MLKYLNLPFLKTHILDVLSLFEKSFLLINPVINSALGRDFHQLR